MDWGLGLHALNATWPIPGPGARIPQATQVSPQKKKGKKKRMKCFLLPSSILSLTLSLLNVDLNLWPISIYDFPFLWRTKFLQGRSPGNAFLQFLSEEVFISSSLMKNNFLGYTAIGGWLIHSPSDVLLHSLCSWFLTRQMWFFTLFLYEWGGFPAQAFLKDLSFLVFCSLNMMCLGVPFGDIISWLVVLWNSWICPSWICH